MNFYMWCKFLTSFFAGGHLVFAAAFLEETVFLPLGGWVSFCLIASYSKFH